MTTQTTDAKGYTLWTKPRSEWTELPSGGKLTPEAEAELRDQLDAVRCPACNASRPMDCLMPANQGCMKHGQSF